MKTTLIGISISPLLAQLIAAQEWMAYNDCIDTESASLNPANITNIGLGRGYQGMGSSGNLIDYETGEDTGVTVTFSENFSAGNTINWAQDFADYTEGTDAAEIFGGIVDLTGNMSYNDAPGWSLDLTIRNLNPNAPYTFAATVHRNGGESYASRITNWTLNGADSATYACSSGAHKVSETSAEFNTGNNIDGLVARWTDIRAGADGTITLRTTHGIGSEAGGIAGADDYKGYAGGVFMLMSQEEEPPLAITTIAHDATLKSTTITWPVRFRQTYVVQVSEDLVTWDDLENDPVIVGETASYTEAEIEAEGKPRFYRVRER